MDGHPRPHPTLFTTLQAVGLFDRLRGRGRYAAGTTPEAAGEAPPEWVGTAPPEGPETTGLSDTVELVSETQDLPEYATDEDLAAAYGWTNLRAAQDPPVDGVLTHTTAAGAAGESLEVYVCDHRAHPGWRSTTRPAGAPPPPSTC